jgi:hypothetical protein
MNQTMSQNRREGEAPPVLTLLELDPADVIEGVRVEQGYLLKEAPMTFGAMRERCPVCQDVPLELVLRQGRVKLAHLFCKKCTRCYDARYADGSCALTLV